MEQIKHFYRRRDGFHCYIYLIMSIIVTLMFIQFASIFHGTISRDADLKANVYTKKQNREATFKKSTVTSDQAKQATIANITDILEEIHILKAMLNISTKNITFNAKRKVITKDETISILGDEKNALVIRNHSNGKVDLQWPKVNDSSFILKQPSINWSLVLDHKLVRAGGKRPNYCPLWPSELIGQMPPDTFIRETELPEAYRKQVQHGGRFRPSECEPRERTAIIIPYRDREQNLKVQLRHLHMVLQRQNLEYGIYVVEMAFPSQFNRGLLANVGFLTASSVSKYTCYVIHDVDLLQMDDRNLYRCGRVPRHLSATNSKFKQLPYTSYFGGVSAFSPEQLWRVNGYSNLYFGWGGEDDDMVMRIFTAGLHISRPKALIGGFWALEHEHDAGNPKNPHRFTLVNSAPERMKSDGLRSVAYKRLALEFKPLYTWVYIGVKEAQVMEKFESYLQDPPLQEQRQDSET
ncbi:beta-1,4-galactosyltransferase 4-like [Mya arenaria]|uniref:beta-1,4-galactosyltransferase 4-like n=1 Tax=Mya arenaria TaxID=6604 RepID=UPI0022E05723|nr:beta-1,4-galactosyltransferase 4-like [Mya arenaria]